VIFRQKIADLSFRSGLGIEIFFAHLDRFRRSIVDLEPYPDNYSSTRADTWVAANPLAFAIRRIVSGDGKVAALKKHPTVITVARYEHPVFVTFAGTRRAKIQANVV
jgi:hypothetical protein